jgi:hypothetical protein
MQFLTSKKRPEVISLEEFQIEECISVKFLGITVDSGLSWSCHISQLCSRLSRICYALRTLQPLLDPSVLLMVYYGYFFSSMTYGIEAWGSSPYAYKVFLVQKRAVRIICGLPPLHSCRGLFRELNLLFCLLFSFTDQCYPLYSILMQFQPLGKITATQLGMEVTCALPLIVLPFRRGPLISPVLPTLIGFHQN